MVVAYGTIASTVAPIPLFEPPEKSPVCGVFPFSLMEGCYMTLSLVREKSPDGDFISLEVN